MVPSDIVKIDIDPFGGTCKNVSFEMSVVIVECMIKSKVVNKMLNLFRTASAATL